MDLSWSGRCPAAAAGSGITRVDPRGPVEEHYPQIFTVITDQSEMMDVELVAMTLQLIGGGCGSGRGHGGGEPAGPQRGRGQDAAPFL